MKRYFFILMLLSLSQECISQTTGSDSVSVIPGVKSAIALYQRITGIQSPLYNGVRHEGYRFGIKGLAYFASPGWEAGSVLYDGILYSNIPMLYDEVGDKLIIHNLEKNAAISLISERVSNFYLLGHTFLYVIAEGDLKTSGFYDMLYRGNVSLLAKREKYIQEKVNQLAIDREFISNYQYYIKKEEQHYLIKNMKSLLKIFEDREREIKLFIKENDLDFKVNPELTLRMIVEYYDQLSNS
ncbi:MAG TPA: hypothetical protein VGD22_07605 [Sphingobacteriaceae bacterium]